MNDLIFECSVTLEKCYVKYLVYIGLGIELFIDFISVIQEG